MKKYLGTIITIIIILLIGLSMFLDNNEKNNEPISIHVFYKNDCEYCEYLFTYLDNLKQDETYGEMFNILKYEISDDNNNALMESVGEYFNYEITGVPFYVIGEQYLSGYSDKKEETIKGLIKTAYNNSNYKDVIEYVKTGEEPVKEETHNGAGIIIVTVLLIGALSIISISKKEN